MLDEIRDASVKIQIVLEAVFGTTISRSKSFCRNSRNLVLWKFLKTKTATSPSFTFVTEKLLILGVMLCLLTSSQKAEGTRYVSNLDNLWAEGGIGDIHGVFPGGIPYGSYTARFTTGAGSFSLNALTLEFLSDPQLTAAQWITLQFFQGSLLLGNLGNPVADSKLTQWPGTTEFINFSPLQPITLNPFTQYSVVASMPANSPVAAGLLFDRSWAYNTPTDWVMGPTTSGNVSASGERLVLAVDATPVPEQASTAVLLLSGFLLLIGCRTCWRSSTD